MMVCTFGDGEDLRCWRRDRLPLRMVVTADGRLGELAGPYAGLTLGEARKAIAAELGVSGKQITHVVGVHERCQTPAEFQIRPQWFIAIRENADRFRPRAAELEWIPEFMRRLWRTGSTGLSGTGTYLVRRYGVPFPVWFCTGCGEPVVARIEDLPVDPLADKPPVPACGAAGQVHSSRTRT